MPLPYLMTCWVVKKISKQHPTTKGKIFRWTNDGCMGASFSWNIFMFISNHWIVEYFTFKWKVSIDELDLYYKIRNDSIIFKRICEENFDILSRKRTFCHWPFCYKAPCLRIFSNETQRTFCHTFWNHPVKDSVIRHFLKGQHSVRHSVGGHFAIGHSVARHPVGYFVAEDFSFQTSAKKRTAVKSPRTKNEIKRRKRRRGLPCLGST